MSTDPTAFTGPVPANYARHLVPFMFEPYAAELLARVPLRPGARILELACGTGVLTRQLRDHLPAGATLVATDLNDAMLEQARAALGGDRVDWRRADAQDLPFADASFDVVACQFGLMFLPDKARGFQQARRVLAARGVLLANVWCSPADNVFVAALQQVLQRLYPTDPPRFLDTPYGFHDADVISGLAAGTGFADVRIERVELDCVAGSAVSLATGFAKGSPLTHALLERGADLDAVVREFAAALAPVGGKTPFRTRLAALVLTARR